MRKLIMILLFLPFLSLASNLELAEQFIKLTDATKVKGATAKDIESILNLLSDEMRYQHPNYGADLTKTEVDEKPLMRLFEFNQDKITLVKEYW